MRSLSRRERLLLVVAPIVILSTAYVVFRLKPRLDLLAENRSIVASRSQALEAESSPDARALRALDERSRTLAAKLAATRAQIAVARKALAVREARFCSRRSSRAVGDLFVAISDAARTAGLHLRDGTPVERTSVHEYARSGAAGPSPARAELLPFLTLDKPYGLPVREVTLDASFSGLRAFLEALARLDAELVLAGFDIEVNAAPQRAPAPLRTRLWLIY